MGDHIVEMNHISKAFSGVKALDDVSFNLKAGEVMALLGENGAGKSTLMKVLSGVYTRDAGTVLIDGQPVDDLTPARAQSLGVAMIHQELNMCTHLSIAENIFLGREITRHGALADAEMNRLAREALSRLNIDLDPATVVGDISVSKQQMVEIAKALSVNARILVMDEPTSALTAREIEDLFAIIRKLKAEGHGIIYISHRLDELRHIVDRVTIMRDGRFITSMNFADTTMDEIVSHMVGREIKEKFPRIDSRRGRKIFEVKHLNAGKPVRNVGFSVYEGEILGIAGLMGAGRTEITRAIFGVDAKDSGELTLDDTPVVIRSPMDAIRAGIVLAPEDRKKDGLCTRLSIRENISLPNLDWIADRLGVVRGRTEQQTVAKAVADLSIRLASPEMNAGNLSGGNQQKVVVAKWLARTSRLVIFDEPTRGIDVAAKVEIYHLMNRLKQDGIGVVFVSSEMPELLGMADRIIVVCEGRITGELDARTATQNQILELAVAFDDKTNGAAA
ncbi:MAG: sugar ABC transporter ATP-binding protein [Methylobacteriaceae bacterium]|jgi:ribose transport system ATP-binding protein|nr:sugar ABC transporter ATP-binding protein [Methylobacteriaceae bacterium]